MKITNLETVLLNADDQEFKDGTVSLTLKRTIIKAITEHVPSDSQAQAKDKEHLYDMFLNFKAANGDVEIDTEDAALIKNRIAQLYPPIIAGQAIKMIENKTQPAKET